MYDWIPIEFDFDILIDLRGTEYAHYHCVSNDADRSSFKVFHDGNLVLSTYYRDSVISSMKNGSKINGMTMDELRQNYEARWEADEIDISSLI